MRRHAGWVVALVCAMGLGLALGSRGTPTAPPPAVVEIADAEELADVKRQVRALAREQGMLLDDVDALSLDLDDVASGSAPAPQPTPVIPDPRAGLAEVQAQAAHLATWFEDQPDDPGWSVEAEDSLLVALASLEGTDVSAACAADACRLELVFESGETRNRTMPQVPFALPWSGEGFLAQGAPDGLSVVVYLAREGASLPRVRS